MRPEQYPDLAALVGETSDNLPGVPGVGPKTAAKWIATYGGLDGILASADDVPGKAGESLRAHLDQVRLNRELNHLLTDLDVDVPVDGHASTRGGDAAAIHAVCDALQFRGLRDKLLAFATVRRGGLPPRPLPSSSIITDEPRRWHCGARRGAARCTSRAALGPTPTRGRLAWPQGETRVGRRPDVANSGRGRGARGVARRRGRFPRCCTASKDAWHALAARGYRAERGGGRHADCRVPRQSGPAQASTLEDDRAALRGRVARRER